MGFGKCQHRFHDAPYAVLSFELCRQWKQSLRTLVFRYMGPGPSSPKPRPCRCAGASAELARQVCGTCSISSKTSFSFRPMSRGLSCDPTGRKDVSRKQVGITFVRTCRPSASQAQVLFKPSCPCVLIWYWPPNCCLRPGVLATERTAAAVAREK